jgi:CRP-like cAMP-binding protein
MATNHILSQMGKNREVLLARAERVPFGRENVFSEPGSMIERVIFPISGMISLVLELADGERVECAMLGARGALGGLAAFGAELHTATAIGQIPGECWSVPTTVVSEIAHQDSNFRGLLLRHEQFLQAQAQQTAACNARHIISERLAGWLLRSRHALGSDQVSLTQEAMAQMLGVQRASVSMAASLLAAQGAIEYKRGRIRIVDAETLAQSACECHRALEQCHRTLFEDIAAGEAGQQQAAAIRQGESAEA